MAMTKKELKGKNLAELKAMAIEFGIKEDLEKTKKEDLIGLIVTASKVAVKNADKMEMGAKETGVTEEDAEKQILDIIGDVNVDTKSADTVKSTKTPKGGKTPKEDKPTNTGKQEDKPKKEIIPDDVVDLTTVPTTMVKVAELVPSKDNMFRPLSEKKFKELFESIKANGMLVPIIVRPMADGNYEILAGHNRMEAMKKLGYAEVPARIVEVTDDKAKEIIIDTNVAQRQELTPMEIARAYNEKKRIIGNRQGQRTDLTQKEQQGSTRDIIAQEYGQSGMTVDRYLRLMKLAPEFVDLIEREDISAKTGMELGLLSEGTQLQVLRTMETNKDISTGKVAKLRKYINEKIKANDGNPVGITDEEVRKIMKEEVAVGTVDNNAPFKLVIQVPADFDEETKEYIKDNIASDPNWLLGIIQKIVKGEIKL